ncbi:hypothetical protein GCM10017621_29360 [Maricaulis virginensis]|uniref:HTH cro/C1-type domain-containing protein n=2 Tax=Maricaulis virginensis TaxID=144022 RepID=A0A9W6MPP4_9PROT|nr:hypothetical protein GCM10017621_29360 [Maricaulis virginensis]
MTQEALNRAIGKALADRRRAAGMRQADVAQSVGISRSSLANIEKGRQALSIFLLYQVADALDVGDPRTLLPRSIPSSRKKDAEVVNIPIGEASAALSDEELAEVTAIVSKTVG